MALRGPSPGSKRRRFLSYAKPSDGALARAFTEREGQGFVGILDAPGPNDGVVVAHASLQPDGLGCAEIAFEVADELQGHGIGSALTETAVEHAQQLGLRRLSATMFADNTPMRRLLRGAGCEIALDQNDAGTEEIALAICSLTAGNEALRLVGLKPRSLGCDPDAPPRDGGAPCGRPNRCERSPAC